MFFTAICLLASLFLASCESNNAHPGYKKTSDGMYYRFYEQNPAAPMAKPTDFLKLKIACYLNDSLYFNWSNTSGEVYAQLSEQKFVGDLQAAYAMLHVGDSASFYIKADSIAKLYYEKDPETVGLKADDYFRYEMKLLEIKTNEDFQAGIDRMKQKLLDDSKSALAAYIEKNGIAAEPSESGIYLITKEKGKGRCPEKGERVEVDFDLKLLDGTPIGSTFGKDNKFSFVLGEGLVIAGWEEVVPKMRLGELVQAIIPCEMAYGEHSVDAIPSYANLVYDIKLLKIITKAEQRKQEEQEKAELKARSDKEFADYLEANNTLSRTPSGLCYIKYNTTNGTMPTEGKVARIKYTAMLMDGTTLGTTDELGGHFDVELGKKAVLKGLEEGIAMMRVGEKARFVFPYTLAYGNIPYGSIPAFANLIFDVELIDVLD